VAAAAAPEQQQQQGDALRVVFLRKAQALAADLGARFGQQDERFRWSDAADLTADSGEFRMLLCVFLFWAGVAKEMVGGLTSTVLCCIGGWLVT
jgi:hypothetical protein